MQIKIRWMQEQLNSFPNYCLKSGTKWFGLNNCDGPFSTLLCISHMTGGSVIWPLCNISHPAPQRIKRQVILWCGWLFLAIFKLVKLHTCWWGLPFWWGWEECPWLPKNCYNALKSSFLVVVIAPLPFLFQLHTLCTHRSSQFWF